MDTSYSSDKSMSEGTPTADGKQEVKSDIRLKDKLANLKAMKRAKGECFKCEEKWGPQHKCSTNVPIHVMEEMLDILQLSYDSKEEDNADQSNSDTELLALSLLCAVAGTSRKKTMRLLGLCGKQEMLILIDSGSSTSFISETIVQKAHLQPSTAPPL